MQIKYTKKLLEPIVIQSKSIAEVARKLNINFKGDNYRTIKKYIQQFGLDTLHFTGQGHNKGKTFPSKRPIEDYLANKFQIGTHDLRLRLIKEGLKSHQCENCLQTQWMNQPMPLQLHHIDGNHENNNLSNLQILCPNCHALTDNYCGKGKKAIKQPKEQKLCIDCQKPIDIKSIRCKSCAGVIRNQLICKRPPKEQLLKDLVELKYWVQVGKKYGVSDNAVRKWAKFYNTPTLFQ